MDSYYTPGTKLDGTLPLSVPARARVVFGEGLLLPVHPRRGRRPHASPRSKQVWNGERYVDMRRAAARARDFSGLPALLQGRAVAGARRRDRRHPASPRDSRDGRAHVIGQKTLLVNPPLVNGVAFTRQGRCQEREEVLGTTKPPYTLALLAVAAARRRLRGPARRSDRRAPPGRGSDRPARSRGLPADADPLSRARRRRSTPTSPSWPS